MIKFVPKTRAKTIIVGTEIGLIHGLRKKILKRIFFLLQKEQAAQI